jgi:hypothetical protein
MTSAQWHAMLFSLLHSCVLSLRYDESFLVETSCSADTAPKIRNFDTCCMSVRLPSFAKDLPALDSLHWHHFTDCQFAKPCLWSQCPPLPSLQEPLHLLFMFLTIVRSLLFVESEVHVGMCRYVLCGSSVVLQCSLPTQLWCASSSSSSFLHAFFEVLKSLGSWSSFGRMTNHNVPELVQTQQDSSS